MGAAPTTEPADVDPWAWAHEDSDPAPVDLSHVGVAAIMVTRNGERWLRQAIDSVVAQDQRPSRFLVVDNGSDDGTRALLEAARERGDIDEIVAGDARWGFGEAVAAAVHRLDDGTAWLWLLHDDMVADPDALRELLLGATAHPGIGIAGPKLLQGSRRGAARHLSELGISIGDAGGRVLGLAPGEIDQGQHEPRDVLGVSTCAMLISRNAWRRLGGFDPAVPLYRDGVELGWRAALLGLRVVTVPTAAVMHRQVGRAELRRGAPAHVTAYDRFLGMRVVAAHERGPAAALAGLGLILANLLRALGFLLGKAPGRAADELRAVGSFVRHGAGTRALRHRVRDLHAARGADQRVGRLRPRRGAAVRGLADGVASRIGEAWRDAFGSSEEVGIDELTGDDFAGGHRRVVRRPWLAPTVALFGALAVLAVVAARGVIGSGHLTGPLLLPAQDTLGGIAGDYTRAIPGSPNAAAPGWLGVILVAATVLLGQPEWAVGLLVLGCVPLAAMAGFAFLRRLATDRRTRLIGACAYGLLPPLLGALNRGDLGLCVTAIVLPLTGMGVLAWRRRGTQGLESWRGAFGVGLGLAVLAAFTPLFWFAALLLAIVVIVVTRSRGQALRAAVALVVPLVLLAPWLPALAAHPGRLLTGPDPVLADAAPAAGLAMLIGRTPGAGLPPLWLGLAFFAVLWAVALAGLALRPRSGRGLAIGAVLALAAAVAVTRVLVAVPATGLAARPSATTLLLLAFGLLVALAVQGWDRVGAHLAERAFGTGQALSLVTAVLAVLAVLGGTVWWAVAGAGGPLHRTSFEQIPAYVLQTQTAPQQLRTLIIDDGPAPRWQLLEGDGARLGDSERGVALGGLRATDDAARTVVADLLNGRADADMSRRLTQLGISTLIVRGISADQGAMIGSVPGLVTRTADERVWMWTVQGTRANVMIVGSDTMAAYYGTTRVPAGEPWRQVVLSQPADARWHATLNGRELKPIAKAGDFRQWFELGDAGGELRLELRSQPWWAWLQLLGVIVVAVLAAPSLKRAEQRDPAAFARRAADLEEAR